MLPGMRKAVVVIVALVLAPLMIAGAVLAGTAILDEVFGAHLNPFDFSGIGWLDWLAAGPGAGPNSFQNFAAFMIGALLAAIPGSIVVALWGWANEPPPDDGGVATRRPKDVPVASGERFRVLENHACRGLTTWRIPYTGGFECTLPAGLVLVCTYGQSPESDGFACEPEEYEANELLFVPSGDRSNPKCSGYYFVLTAPEIGSWFGRI